VAEPNGPRAPGGDTSARDAGEIISIRSIDVESDHGRLHGCSGDIGWRYVETLCESPEWTAQSATPISHTMGEKIRLRIEVDRAPSRPVVLRGEGPDGVLFRQSISSPTVSAVSEGALPRALSATSLDIEWSIEGEGPVAPSATRLPMFITFGPPPERPKSMFGEEGPTPRRMEKAIEWAAEAESLDPHTIVASFLRRFPFYALEPNKDVPRELDHPRYFNDLGGAWPMVDHVAASGECQAIVRLVRGLLAQLGAPGEARMIVVWADPMEGGGKKPLFADWDENPRAGLSRRIRVGDKELVAALVDGPVIEGKKYKASHTLMEDGTRSPGLNRYEACLEFSHGGITRYYCGGVGVLSSKQDILKVFWGLVWVEMLPDEGYRVEKIVQRYQGGSARSAGEPRERARSSVRRFFRGVGS